MKKKFLWAAALVAAAGLTSCKVDEFDGERQPSPVPDADQAFVEQGTKTSLTFTPAQDTMFVVIFGRSNAAAANGFALSVDTAGYAGVFEIPERVEFAAGAAQAQCTIKFSLRIGSKAVLTIGFADNDAYAYGLQAVTINVLRDYEWVEYYDANKTQKVGTAEYTSEFEGETKDIKIEWAKGTNRYRLVDCYNVLYPDAKKGYHIQFVLDDDYNAHEFPSPQEIGETYNDGGTARQILMVNDITTGSIFMNTGNLFTLRMFFGFRRPNGTLPGWGQMTEKFVWKDGYKGVIPAPIPVSYQSTLTSADDVRGWTLGDSAAYLSPDDGIMLYYYGAGEEAAKAVSPKFATFNIDTIADTLTFAYMAGYQTYLQVFSDTFAAKFRRDTAACNAAGEACTQTLTQIRTAAQNYARTQAGMAAQAVTTIVKVSVWDAWSGQAAQELFTKTIDGEDNLEDDVVIVPLDAYKGKDIKVIVEITQGDFTFWNFAAAASTARARLFP